MPIVPANPFAVLNSRLYNLPLPVHMCAQGLKDREVCVYSVSCKRQTNIDITLDWLTRHAKS